MILNLVPVLFHLLFYQYLIFQLLILVRETLLHKAHSAEMADVHPRCRKCIYPESTCAPVLGSEGFATALDEDSSSLVNISVHSLATLQSHVLGQEGWFTASEKLGV